MFEVYSQKWGSRKWKLIGTKSTKEEAINFGAYNGEGGFFTVYDCEKDEWVDITGDGKKWWET
jgi:hypothetical protein